MCVFQMSSAHIVTLCASVLMLAGPANGMLGPGVDFNPESFHWAMTDVLTNAGFKRMEVRWDKFVQNKMHT